MPKINERFIKDVATPVKGSKIYYDDILPGFGLRVTKSAAKAFVLNFHIDRHERRITIGRHPAWSARAAREEASRLRRQIDQGIDPLEKREARAVAPTISDLWCEYRAKHLSGLSVRSQKDQTSMWEQLILPDLAMRKVADLGPNDIDNLHSRISESTPTRANRVLEVLRKALNLAIRRGWIDKNPANGFTRNAEHKRERYLTSAEYDTVLSAIDIMPNQKAADAIRLLVLTGARRGEVLGAMWEEFDLEKGLWIRAPHRNKDRKAKRIPLSGAALTLLSRMKEGASGSLLFPTINETPMSDLNRPWGWLKLKTGLDDSFASLLVSNGQSLETIGALLGHTQLQTTMRYAHLYDDTMRAAADSFSKSLTGKF